MNSIIISILSFFVVAIAYSVIIVNRQSSRRRKVLKLIRADAPNTGVDKTAASGQRKSGLAQKLKESESTQANEKGNSVALLIQHAGMDISVKKFWLLSLLFAIFFTFLIHVWMGKIFVTCMAFIIGFLGLPKIFLKRKASKRQKKFLEEFADALESMTRLLKAGMPVSEAISMVAREYTGPVGEEMGRIFDQQKIGIPLSEAVLNGAKRMPLPEMQMFATAVAIQAQTGSSLSEVLQNLAGVIRDRFSLKRKVAALSSEAKASAGIIGALPLLVMAGMYFTNRDYIMILFETPVGNVLLAAAAFWMACGIFVMRQMINFKV